MWWGVNDMQQTLDMGGIEPLVIVKDSAFSEYFSVHVQYKCLIFKVKKRLNVLCFL